MALLDGWSWSITVIALLTAATAIEKQPPVVAPTFAVRPPVQITLPNGLRLLHLTDTRAPYFEARLVVSPAAAGLTDAETALLPLLRELIPYGTAAISRDSLQHALTNLGLSLEVGVGPTDEDGHTLSVRMAGLASDVPAALALLHTLVASPALRQTDVDSVARILLQRTLSTGDLRAWSYNRARQIGQTALTPTDSATLLDPRLTDRLRTLHRRAFRADIATLVVSGPFSVGQLRPWASAAFSEWASAPRVTGRHRLVQSCRAISTHSGHTTVDSLIRVNSAQTNVVLATSMASASGAEHAHLAIVAALLRNRLVARALAESWQSYGARVLVTQSPCERMLALQASVPPTQAAMAARAVHEILDSLRSAPLPQAEVDAAARTVVMLRLGEAISQSRAIDQVLMREINGDPKYWRLYGERLTKASSADIRAFATRYLGDGQRIWVVAGDSTGVAAALQRRPR